VLLRALEEEVSAFLGRARYQREPDARGLEERESAETRADRGGGVGGQCTPDPGKRRALRQQCDPDRRTAVRTRPLEALIIGGWVRGLSDRDIESLVK
jgi:hypothetical protein